MQRKKSRVRYKQSLSIGKKVRYEDSAKAITYNKMQHMQKQWNNVTKDASGRVEKLWKLNKTDYRLFW